MKKIFSFVVVMAAVAMVSCCGNSNKKAAESGAAAAATDAATNKLSGMRVREIRKNPLFLCPVFLARPESCEGVAVPCSRF